MLSFLLLGGHKLPRKLRVSSCFNSLRFIFTANRPTRKPHPPKPAGKPPPALPRAAASTRRVPSDPKAQSRVFSEHRPQGTLEIGLFKRRPLWRRLATWRLPGSKNPKSCSRLQRLREVRLSDHLGVLAASPKRKRYLKSLKSVFTVFTHSQVGAFEEGAFDTGDPEEGAFDTGDPKEDEPCRLLLLGSEVG